MSADTPRDQLDQAQKEVAGVVNFLNDVPIASQEVFVQAFYGDEVDVVGSLARYIGLVGKPVRSSADSATVSQVEGKVPKHKFLARVETAGDDEALNSQNVFMTAQRRRLPVIGGPVRTWSAFLHSGSMSRLDRTEARQGSRFEQIIPYNWSLWELEKELGAHRDGEIVVPYFERYDSLPRDKVPMPTMEIRSNLAQFRDKLIDLTWMLLHVTGVPTIYTESSPSDPSSGLRIIE